MAIRHLLLAALVSSAFSAQAAPGSIYASTGTGTVLLATTATGQVQTYMPRAVEGFYTYSAQTAPLLLTDSGQSTAPAGAELIHPTPDIALAELPVGGATDISADLGTGATDISADLGTGTTVDAAAPTVLLPVALDANAVPEPGTGGLMLAGLAGVGFMARRRRTR